MADDGGTQGATSYTAAQVEEMVSGLKAKNSEILGSLAKTKDQLKAFEGLDPEKIRTVLSEHEKALAERQKTQGDWDAREKTLRESFKADHEKIVTPLQSEVTSLRTNLFDAVAVRDAIEAMADPDIKANPKLILPVMRHELAVEVVDGKQVTVVRGADGKPRYHPTTNKLVTVKDRLKELRAEKEFAGGFEGAGGSGSGTRASDPGAGSVDKVHLTAEQAGDHATLNAALKKVGGDYSRIEIAA
jgi:hypothetical protein